MEEKLATANLVNALLQMWQQIKQAFFRTEKTQLLLRGSVGSLVVRSFGVALKVLLGIFLARELGASSYGIYAYAAAWLAFLTVPTTMGLDQVLIRYVAAYKEARAWHTLKGVLRFAATLGVGAAIVVCVIAITVVASLSGMEPELRTTMWIMFAILPVVVMAQVRQGSLRALDQPVRSLLPETIFWPVLLMVFVGGAHWLLEVTPTVSQVALASAAAWVITFVIGTVFLLRALPESARTCAPAYERAQWMAMIPSLIVTMGAYYVLSRADVLILGAFRTTREVGIYTVANRGAELVIFMYDAITIVGSSLFYSIYATGDREELQRFTRLVTKTILWATLPVCLILLVFAPLFLRLFGVEFVEGAGAMRLLTSAYFLMSLTGFVHIMLYAAGRQRDVAIVMVITAAVNIGLSFLLIPLFGMIGAAISLGTSLLVLKGTLVVVLYKRVGLLSLPISLTRKAATQDG